MNTHMEKSANKMMMKTHLAMGILAGLILMPYVDNKWIFMSVVILSTLLPDIDSMHSYLGKRIWFRPLQWFVKHRGLLHSLSFCLLVCLLFALFLPILALPFFVGYGVHLFADSITIEGVRLWWPLKGEISGDIKTNGKIEKIIFYTCCGLIVVGIVFYLSLYPMV